MAFPLAILTSVVLSVRDGLEVVVAPAERSDQTHAFLSLTHRTVCAVRPYMGLAASDTQSAIHSPADASTSTVPQGDVLPPST